MTRKKEPEPAVLLQISNGAVSLCKIIEKQRNGQIRNVEHVVIFCLD